MRAIATLSLRFWPPDNWLERMCVFSTRPTSWIILRHSPRTSAAGMPLMAAKYLQHHEQRGIHSIHTTKAKCHPLTQQTHHSVRATHCKCCMTVK